MLGYCLEQHQCAHECSERDADHPHAMLQAEIDEVAKLDIEAALVDRILIMRPVRMLLQQLEADVRCKEDGHDP